MLIALLTFTLTHAALPPAVRASQKVSEQLRRLSARPSAGYLDHRTGSFVFTKNLNFDWRQFHGQERVALMRLGELGVWVSDDGARYDLRKIQMWFLGESESTNALVAEVMSSDQEPASGGGADEFEDRLILLPAPEMFYDEDSGSVQVRATSSVLSGLDQSFIDEFLLSLAKDPVWTGPSRRTYDFSDSEIYLFHPAKRSRDRELLREHLLKTAPKTDELLRRAPCKFDLIRPSLPRPGK